ncbi:MAG: 7-cyano-7-deazaguanine synthase QueC [Planctomycetes bacterium]|nr:7-cyano-7-deazaguanine synthase QueC [Planctomycetota bacterium]
MKPAIVLLSGGLDSATVLAIAVAEGFEPLALSFRYGQRHVVELEAARNVAAAAGVCEHKILDIDLRAFGGSALTDEIEVPKDHDPTGGGKIPITYVPARNTIFLAFALAYAEVRDARDIYIGVNALDYSGYPDCRPEFVAAFENMAAVATKSAVEGGPVKIHAPLMSLTRERIIRRGLELGVDYGLTRSCYDPDDAGRACGHCDSCQLRLDAFAKVGVTDPAPYITA